MHIMNLFQFRDHMTTSNTSSAECCVSIMYSHIFSLIKCLLWFDFPVYFWTDSRLNVSSTSRPMANTLRHLRDYVMCYEKWHSITLHTRKKEIKFVLGSIVRLFSSENLLKQIESVVLFSLFAFCSFTWQPFWFFINCNRFCA